MRRGAAHTWVVALAGVIALFVAVSGCSAAHPPLALGNGSVSACFRALPVAKAAVHDSTARFVGVTRVAADHIEQQLSGTTPDTGADNDTKVCALAFHGVFAAGQVTGAPSSQQGAYAVVLVTSKDLKLLRSFVGSELPVRFGHHL